MHLYAYFAVPNYFGHMLLKNHMGIPEIQEKDIFTLVFFYNMFSCDAQTTPGESWDYIATQNMIRQNLN
jgi:hypothetical protein